MPIHLITGLPGSGKSLSAVELLYKLARKDGASRPVYAVGIDGLVDGLAEPLDDPRRWESLPDGSLVVVDEAQKFFPTHRGETPGWVRALSEHRHRGMDFVLVTQHPAMIDSYVRRLVGEHTHVVRRWGSKVATRYRWGEVVEDVQSSTARSRGVQSQWRYPKDLFRLYKSATLHTVKARIPWQIYAFGAVLVLVPLLGYFGWRKLSSIGAADTSGHVDSGREAKMDRRPNNNTQKEETKDKNTKAKRIQYDTALEYAQMHTPRIASLPWSAPAFDDRRPTVDPDIYCVLSEAKGCRCYTEQVTRYVIDDAQCRVIAHDGVYNPYRRRAAVVTRSADGNSAKRESQAVEVAGKLGGADQVKQVESQSDPVSYGSPDSPAVPGSAWVLGPQRQGQ